MQVAGAPVVDTLVTFLGGSAVKGIIVHGNAGNDEVRVRAVITGLAASREFLLTGGTTGCDAPWSTNERASKLRWQSLPLGVIFGVKRTPLLLGVAVGDVNGDGRVDAADLAAWRIKRTSGQSVGCYAVDSRLARHQS